MSKFKFDTSGGFLVSNEVFEGLQNEVLKNAEMLSNLIGLNTTGHTYWLKKPTTLEDGFVIDTSATPVCFRIEKGTYTSGDKLTLRSKSVTATLKDGSLLPNFETERYYNQMLDSETLTNITYASILDLKIYRTKGVLYYNTGHAGVVNGTAGTFTAERKATGILELYFAEGYTGGCFIDVIPNPFATGDHVLNYTVESAGGGKYNLKIYDDNKRLVDRNFIIRYSNYI